MNNLSFKIWLENTSLPAKIISPREDIHEIMEANLYHGVILGRQLVPANSLHGGVRLSDPQETNRVQRLAQQISSPNGYFERIIVDDRNNVIEGQHRLEALNFLGIQQVPIVRVLDLANKYNEKAMTQAVAQVQRLHPDYISQIVRRTMDMLYESGSIEKALSDYEMPPQYKSAFEAAIKASSL